MRIFGYIFRTLTFTGTGQQFPEILTKKRLFAIITKQTEEVMTMKHSLRAILILLMSAVMILSLPACQETDSPETTVYEPESAIDLWQKVDDTMSALDSMELETEIKATYYYMGYQYDLAGTAFVLTTKEAHYTKNETSVSCEELSMEQNVCMIEAYHDGKMYSAMDNGVYSQKFCSPITQKDYEQIQTGKLTEEIDVADCTNATFAKEEDGGWSLQFSGYTKKTVDKTLSTLDISEDMMGAPIADMQVSLVADEDFHVRQMQITFSFSAADGTTAPEFSVTAKYSAYNTAQFDPAVLEADTYVEVDDVHILEDIATLLKERQDAAEGKFTLDTQTTFSIQGNASTTREKDTILYGKKNGAYYYDITAKVEDEMYRFMYQNGEQTVITSNESYANEQTDVQAKAYIDGLIDSARYNGSAVTGIEKQSEGVYYLKIDKLDYSEYAENFVDYGIELNSASQKVNVVLAQNRILQIVSKVTLKGNYSGTQMVVTVESVVTFRDGE